MKTEHTPTPWTTSDGRVYCGSRDLMGIGRDNQVAVLMEDIANMEFICAAVNCHDELVKSLDDLLRKTSSIEALGEWEALDINKSLGKTTRASVDEAINAARAILKKAKGEA